MFAWPEKVFNTAYRIGYQITHALLLIVLLVLAPVLGICYAIIDVVVKMVVRPLFRLISQLGGDLFGFVFEGYARALLRYAAAREASAPVLVETAPLLQQEPIQHQSVQYPQQPFTYQQQQHQKMV